MTGSPHFISIDDAILFHRIEISKSGGATGIRDMARLESALGAPRAGSGTRYFMDVFEMAATYVESICMNHPFIDGNKRVSVLCALVFSNLNGYEIIESYDEEIADMVLALLAHKIDKAALADYFRNSAILI
jgi:death-on-curing protein